MRRSPRPPRPGEGMPTKYKPEYCEELIKQLAQGATITEFAASINVNRDTVYNWFKLFPEFREAKALALTKCRAWWEAQGRKALWNKEFNNTVWIFTMKNRFGWNDRTETKQTVEANVKTESSLNSDLIELLRESVQTMLNERFR